MKANSPAGSTTTVNMRREWATYDNLPPDIRTLFAHVPRRWSALQLWEQARGNHKQFISNLRRVIERQCPDWRPLRTDPAICWEVVPRTVDLGDIVI